MRTITAYRNPRSGSSLPTRLHQPDGGSGQFGERVSTRQKPDTTRDTFFGACYGPYWLPNTADPDGFSFDGL